MNIFLLYVNNISMIQSLSHVQKVSIGEIALVKDVNSSIYKWGSGLKNLKMENPNFLIY